MRTLAVFLAALLVLPQMAEAELWVVTRTHKVANRGSLIDARAMFEADAPWAKVAAHTDVVELGPGDVLSASAADLGAVIADLKRRHIKLAVEMSLLARTPDCQAKNEAYLPDTDLITRMLGKIAQNGGDVRYINMDEPFHFGTRWTGPTACHETAEALAVRIRDGIAVARRVFPNVLVGDTEVVDTSRPWIDSLAGWADTFRQATGQKLAFFHSDVNWSGIATRNLVPLAAAMRQRGIPFGVIYDADAGADSDLAWTTSALSHIATIEGPLGLHPDQPVVQTWVNYPSHALPEDAPGTLTNVALDWLAPAPVLQAGFAGGDVRGRLTDAAGRPIAGAALDVETTGAGRPQMTMRSLSGVVPQAAQTAMIGVRAGAEGACICAGATEVSVGTITYREDGGQSAEVAPGRMGHLSLEPGEPDNANLQSVPVTPGAHFTLQAPMAAPEAATHAGYVTAIFRDGSGHGIGRKFLWFEPGTQHLGAVTTDARGRFRVAAPGSAVSVTYLRGHPVEVVVQP